MTYVIVLLILAASLADVNAQSNPLCLSGATPFQIDTKCAPGWYCPLYVAGNSSTYPVQCAPTNDCLLDRLKTQFCERQGTYEPMLCDKGFYCPSPTEMIECPAGSVCYRGQFEPTPCGSITSCPAGSDKRTEMTALVAFFIADVGIIVLWLLARAWKRRQNNKRDVNYTVLPLNSINSSIMRKGDMFKELPVHSKVLCQGFKRAQSDLPPIYLHFNNLSLSIPASKRGQPHLAILKGVTGTIEPSKVTAIMGPSGAGKTTFLNTMLGKVDSSWERGGSLKINGVDERLGRFRKLIGYVPQEDVMHRDLTVHENISYSASVRLPSDWTSEQRDDHVNATVAAMQLKGVQDSRIGDEVVRGISGGQRKRCNIGIEVAAAPSLLLLDEPTSGLDSTAALEICQVLKDLARVSSITVAMVIHQPRVEIWNQLDEVLLLAPGGLTAYQGPQRLAVRYFQERFDLVFSASENPADALMDRIAEQGDEFVKLWNAGGEDYVNTLKDTQFVTRTAKIVDTDEEIVKETPDSVTIRVLPPRANSSLLRVPPAFPARTLRTTAGFFRQTQLAFVRNLWKQLANLPSLALEVGLGLIAGSIMGATVKVAYQGVLSPPYTLLSPTPLEGIISQFFFNVGLAVSLAAASAGVSVFGEEQVIYRREVAAGHNHLAYYIGVSAAQLPRLFINGLHFAVVFHLINQPITPFGSFLAISFLLYTAIYGLAAFVSFCVARKNAALLGVVLSLLMSSMVRKGGFPEQVQWFSASRWAAEAIFTYETEPYRHIMEVQSVSANDSGYELDRVSLDLFIMFLVGMFYRVVAYLVMRWSDRKIIVST